MKRFLLFTYDDYYPSGARGDLYGDFDSLEEAIANLPDSDADYADILDMDERKWTSFERPWSITEGTRGWQPSKD